MANPFFSAMGGAKAPQGGQRQSYICFFPRLVKGFGHRSDSAVPHTAARRVRVIVGIAHLFLLGQSGQLWLPPHLQTWSRGSDSPFIRPIAISRRRD